MAFQIIRNDITKVAADAIVNTANPDPCYGSGTDGAIYAAAGADELLAERAKIGTMEVGEAKATPAFALPAKYIIHTVGPAWDGGEHGEFENLRKCYENSLKLAGKLGCESIAFPLISTGVYGFPKDKALQTAISVFSEFLSDHEMEITLVVFDPKSFELSGQIFAGVDEFIDNNYVTEQIDEEYGSEEAFGHLAHSEPRRRRLFGHLLGASGSETSGRSDSVPLMPEGEPMHYMSMADMDSDYGIDLSDEDRLSAPELSCAAPAPMASKPHGLHIGSPGKKKGSLGKKKGSPKTLDDAVSHISDTWQESLLHLIDEKGFTDVEVYKRANVDRKLFSKIRANKDYQPKKITAVAFALALKLSLDETRDMLARAGYALSPSSRFDLIIEYFIQNGIYDTYSINLALFEYDQPLLGA